MTQRVQLALNVENLEEAITFYSKLFGRQVNKRKPGYANFTIDEPPLKLVLFENPEAVERINHLGVEVSAQEDVAAATARFVDAGIAGEQEIAHTCCYATQDKIWTEDPQGLKWEWYRVLEDSETFSTPAPESESKATAPESSAKAAPTGCC